MKLTTFLIDTFTVTPFTGNPTVVCLHHEDLSSTNMLSIASEFNCPVTAFINLKTDQLHRYEIRYFTTITEIPACGHATLAAAKLLLEDENNAVHFSTLNNTVIEAFLNGKNVLMVYPVFQQNECDVSHELLSALRLPEYLTAMYSNDLETLFIEISSASLLKTIEPDYTKLLKSSDTIKEVVIISGSDDPKYDYFLRSFCPWIGIDEDPVTGSVHSVLGNFWKQRLNKPNLKAYQASARGGEIEINAFHDRVEIGGKAVIIMKGEITL